MMKANHKTKIEVGLSVPFRDGCVRFSCLILVLSLLIGCSKSANRMDRAAPTKLYPEDAVLFLVDAQSQEKSLEVEAKIARHLSRAMKRDGNIRVLSSKDFFPEVAEPFYSSEDIMKLLQETPFKEQLEAERIHYIVLADVEAIRSGWYKDSNGWGGESGVMGAGYYKKFRKHVTEATVIDVKQCEIAGVIGADYSTSSGYGYAGVFGWGYPPVCCFVPIGWYGGDSEDPAFKALAINVAKFLSAEDLTQNSERHK